VSKETYATPRLWAYRAGVHVCSHNYNYSKRVEGECKKWK